MTELEQYINSCFELSEEDGAKIASRFKSEIVKKGDFFLTVDSVANKFSFVQSGLLRVYGLYKEKEVTQWVATKGSFITELSSFLFGNPSRFNMQALTDTHLYTIDKEEYESIVEDVPGWPKFERHFIANCFTIMENRIFSHLAMSAEERYDNFLSQHKELFIQLPQQYIASMLGMTPETFSRIRKNQLP